MRCSICVVGRFLLVAVRCQRRFRRHIGTGSYRFGQQYDASDGFGGLGSEALPSRVRLVGVSARGLLVRGSSTVLATGLYRRYNGARSC